MRSLAIIIASLTAAVAVAHADDELPKADALFAEAEALRDAGNATAACAKFEEALKYNRNAVGTMLNVALCDEQAGKLASAVKLFADARDLAREHHLVEHLQAAEEHLAKDEPMVAHLAIAFTEPPGADTKLLIDDEVIPTSSADDVPVDPGRHTITVTAPGRLPNETRVDVARLQHKAVAIPKLAYPPVRSSRRTVVGKVIVIGGTALVATGVTLGLFARSDYRSQFDPDSTGVTPCSKVGTMTVCNSDGLSKTQKARTLGGVGTVVGGAGVVAIGVGALLWLLPHDTRENAGVVPVVAPDRVGLAVVGSF